MRRKTGPADKNETPSRLIALSDGLFATVLTLLVLDLRPAGAQGVHEFLKGLGPHLFSYLLTFLVSGTYWLSHHRDLDLVVRHDRTLLGYNLLFLLFIGLLPFSTAAIGQSSLRSDEYPFYWALYSTNIILAGCMLTLTWGYAVRSGLVDKKALARSRRDRCTPAPYPGYFRDLDHGRVRRPEGLSRSVHAPFHSDRPVGRRQGVSTERRPCKGRSEALAKARLGFHALARGDDSAVAPHHSAGLDLYQLTLRLLLPEVSTGRTFAASCRCAICTWSTSPVTSSP